MATKVMPKPTTKADSDLARQLLEDIKVDKYRISGFWDTPLNSILKNLDVHQK
jgi:nicotinamidase-related amidase